MPAALMRVGMAAVATQGGRGFGRLRGSVADRPVIDRSKRSRLGRSRPKHFFGIRASFVIVLEVLVLVPDPLDCFAAAGIQSEAIEER